MPQIEQAIEAARRDPLSHVPDHAIDYVICWVGKGLVYTKTGQDGCWYLLDAARLLVAWAARETGGGQDELWGAIQVSLGGDVHLADQEVRLICYYMADLLTADPRNPGGGVLLSLAARIIAYVAAYQATTTEKEI